MDYGEKDLPLVQSSLVVGKPPMPPLIRWRGGKVMEPALIAGRDVRRRWKVRDPRRSPG